MKSRAVNQNLNMLWISGWGLPPSWLNERVEGVFPGENHTVVPPSRQAMKLLCDPARFDRVAGYSLGAFLLLKSLLGPEEQRVDPKKTSIALLAPFFSFPSESGHGGRIPSAQVIFLARWLKKDPHSALRDFYRRSGLAVAPSSLSSLPYPFGDLLWGLEWLINGQIAPFWSLDWIGLCGEDDPLLDAERLKDLVPSLQILPGTGHNPEPMLKELRNIWSPRK